MFRPRSLSIPTQHCEKAEHPKEYWMGLLHKEVQIECKVFVFSSYGELFWSSVLSCHDVVGMTRIGVTIAARATRKIEAAIIDAGNDEPALKRIVPGKDASGIIQNTLSEPSAAVEGRRNLAASTNFPASARLG